MLLKLRVLGALESSALKRPAAVLERGEEDVKKSRKAFDSDNVNIDTRRILKQVCDPVKQLPETEDDLRKHFLQPFNPPLPIALPRERRDRTPVSSDDPDIYHDPSERHFAIADMLHDVADCEMQRSQDLNHYCFDTMILRPLKLISDNGIVQLQFSRNAKDSSSTVVPGQKRPDFLTHLALRSCLVFFGEEESNDIDKATSEMMRKISPCAIAFAGVPYIFSYAATSSLFNLYVIMFGPQVRSYLIASCKLTTVSGRLSVVRLMINLAKLLPLFEQRIPHYAPKLWTTCEFTDNRPTIMIRYGLDSVEKFVQEGIDLTARQPLYSVTEAPSGRSPHVARVHFSAHDSTKLVISPLGSVFPSGPSEELVIRAFRHIVLGVKWLHSKGWSHQDIRWSNVAFKEPNFFLIDLENAKRIPDDEEDRKTVILVDVEYINELARKYIARLSSASSETATGTVALLTQVYEAKSMDQLYSALGV